MKKASKIKLSALSAEELKNNEMNLLQGGGRACECSCYYADKGGSSIEVNRDSNYNGGSHGLTSENGEAQACAYEVNNSHNSGNTTFPMDYVGTMGPVVVQPT